MVPWKFDLFVSVDKKYLVRKGKKKRKPLENLKASWYVWCEAGSKRRSW